MKNFLIILGYSYRLEDISQRVFFTFSEGVYAIDLDKLMRNEDSLKLNSIVYILVLETIIKEYKTKEINEEQKAKAKEVYKKIITDELHSALQMALAKIKQLLSDRNSQKVMLEDIIKE